MRGVLEYFWVWIAYVCCAGQNLRLSISLLLHCIAVSGVRSSPCLNFNIGEGDDMMIVVERWLNLRGMNAEVFSAGAHLMWALWKRICKWIFEKISFNVGARLRQTRHRYARKVLDNLPLKLQNIVLHMVHGLRHPWMR